MKKSNHCELKIRSKRGWFAADKGWQRALEKLSDGAFKLFVYVSLHADKTTGSYDFRQQDLSQVLNKSRRSVGTYLKELQEKQVVVVQAN